MVKVKKTSVIELHELCMDICPFPAGDRKTACPACPVSKAVETNGHWRFHLVEATKIIRDWTKYLDKLTK